MTRRAPGARQRHLSRASQRDLFWKYESPAHPGPRGQHPLELTNDHRRTQRDQEQRVPRRHHRGRRPRIPHPRPRGPRRARRGPGLRHHGRGIRDRRRRDRRRSRRRLGPRRHGDEGQGTGQGRIPPLPQGPDPLHLPAPGRRAGTDPGTDQLRRHRHRLRDRPGRPDPAAAGPDVRGCRPAVRAGGRHLPDGPGRRQGRAARRRPGRPSGQGRCPGRRCCRHQRRRHGPGPGRRRHHPGHQHQPPPRTGRPVPGPPEDGRVQLSTRSRSPWSTPTS